MANPEQKNTEQQEQLSVEALIGSFGPITRMPEGTTAEASAKRDAYNAALQTLDARVGRIHSQNESGNDSLDDNGQEESEDERQRGVIALTDSQFRSELSRLHEVILKLGS